MKISKSNVSIDTFIHSLYDSNTLCCSCGYSLTLQEQSEQALYCFDCQDEPLEEPFTIFEEDINNDYYN